MKYSAFFVIAFLATVFSAYGQKPVVPENILKAFEQKVPNAKSIQYEYDSAGGLWEIEYKFQRAAFTSAFDKNGKWIETEKDLRFSKLPSPVKAALKADYADFKAQEVEFVESSKGSFYEIEIASKKKGKNAALELLFSLDGKLISKEEEKDDTD